MVRCLALPFIIALCSFQAEALELVYPKEDEEVCLIKPAVIDFLLEDGEKRREQFLDKEWRNYAAKTVKSSPVPLKFEWRGSKAPCEVLIECEGRTFMQANVTGETMSVWNLEIARRFKWSVKDAAGVVRVGTFRTSELPPRAIHLAGVPNFRDLGGCSPTAPSCWRLVTGVLRGFRSSNRFSRPVARRLRWDGAWFRWRSFTSSRTSGCSAAGRHFCSSLDRVP